VEFLNVTQKTLAIFQECTYNLDTSSKTNAALVEELSSQSVMCFYLCFLTLTSAYSTTMNFCNICWGFL